MLKCSNPFQMINQDEEDGEDGILKLNHRINILKYLSNISIS